MPSKRRLVTSEICFGTEKAGLLDFLYNKCALRGNFALFLSSGDYSLIDMLHNDCP